MKCPDCGNFLRFHDEYGFCNQCGKWPVTLCLECHDVATWVRRTQFAGDHPYCQEHAEQEDNWGKEDPSYFVWEAL